MKMSISLVIRSMNLFAVIEEIRRNCYCIKFDK